MNIYKTNRMHKQFIKDLHTLINHPLVTIKSHSLCPFDYLTLSYTISYDGITVYRIGVKSKLVGYDLLTYFYKAITRALPIHLNNNYSLDYDSNGYSYLKVAKASNLEFFNCKAKRISTYLASYLYDVLDCGDVKIICKHTNKYMSSYDFNISYTFQI